MFSFGEVNPVKSESWHSIQDQCKGTSFYVGGIPYRSTEDDMKKAFGEAGNGRFCEYHYDRVTGRSRGFGFVEMATGRKLGAAIDR